MTIIARNGTFGVRVYDPTARRKRWVGTFPNLRAAKRAELAAMDEHSSGITVKGFAEEWLILFPRPAESTRIHYAERVSGFVSEHGDRRLEQITPLIARTFAAKHPSALAALKAMFNDAKKIDLISSSPFAAISKPSSRGRRDLQGLSVEWIDTLIRSAVAVHGDYGEQVFAPVLEFVAFTGLRAGEIYGLRFEDVDVENRVVHVRRALNQKTGTMGTTKSDRERSVYLPDRALDAFKRVSQVGERVFVTGAGKPMSGRLLHYWWHPVRCTAGRPEFAFHGLRHFYGTWLANNGVGPMQIAKMMGHADGGRLAMSLYIHVTEADARSQVAAALGEQVRQLRGVR